MLAAQATQAWGCAPGDRPNIPNQMSTIEFDPGELPKRRQRLFGRRRASCGIGQNT